LPGADASVLYAELVWGASYRYGGENVTPYLDVPVTLAFGEDAISVAPDASTASTLDYVAPGSAPCALLQPLGGRHRFVKSHRAASTLSRGPGDAGDSGGPYAAAGWSLVSRIAATERSNDVDLVGSRHPGRRRRSVDYPAYFCAPKSACAGPTSRSSPSRRRGRAGDRSFSPSALEPFLVLSGPNNRHELLHQRNRPSNNGGAQNHGAVSGEHGRGVRGCHAPPRRLGFGALAPISGVGRPSGDDKNVSPPSRGHRGGSRGSAFLVRDSTATVSPRFLRPATW
jgi:hypothetical protein